jgi:hypothetical protein
MATKPSRVKAREACVVTVGARPPIWPTAIVRNNRTGKLDEVVLHEAEPIDPGSEGIGYVFTRGEEVEASHPAVVDAPGAFVPIDEPRSD